MLRLSVGLRLIFIVAIALVILLSVIAGSWAATSEDEVCDLNADFALGLADYPAAIACIVTSCTRTETMRLRIITWALHTV